MQCNTVKCSIVLLIYHKVEDYLPVMCLMDDFSEKKIYLLQYNKIYRFYKMFLITYHLVAYVTLNWLVGPDTQSCGLRVPHGPFHRPCTMVQWWHGVVPTSHGFTTDRHFSCASGPSIFVLATHIALHATGYSRFILKMFVVLYIVEPTGY